MSARVYDIVVLSSSPPIPLEQYAPSSPLNASPDFSPRRAPMPASPLPALSPPISPLKKASGASGGTSRKASIPPDAIRGFATVGSLVRSEHFAQQQNDEDTHVQKAKQPNTLQKGTEDAGIAPKKPSKRSAKSTTAEEGTKSRSKPRARKPKAATDDVAHDAELRLPAPKISPYFTEEGAEESNAPQQQLTKAGKPRKSRAKKENAEGGALEPKAKKTRAVKTKAVQEVGGNDRATNIVDSAYFCQTAEENTVVERTDAVGQKHDQVTRTEDTPVREVPQNPGEKKKRATRQKRSDPLAEGLQLEEAVSRRRDWTPPRDTVIASSLCDSVGKENRPKEIDDTTGHFTHMVANFAYTHASPRAVTSTTAVPNMENMAATKRRRAELIDVPNNQANSRNSSPEKGKAPKKKPRTITDRATEQYLPRVPQDDPSAVTSDFFDARVTTIKVPLNDADVNTKPTRKRATKRTSETSGAGTKPKKVSAKATAKAAAKAKLVAEKLLSPSSAMTRMNKQDILFGTSSQLALEESPTMVRQIQLAIKESEVEADASLEHLLRPPPRWPRLGKVQGTRGLWNASSRDDEGGLLEQVRDVYIPKFDRTQDFPLLMDGTIDAPVAESSSFVDIDKIPLQPVAISSDPPTPARATSQPSRGHVDAYTRDNAMEDSKFEDIDDLDSQPPPSNQHVESQASFADIDDIILTPSAQLISGPPLQQRPPVSAPTYAPPKERQNRPPGTQSAKFTKAKIPTLKKSVSAPPLTPSKGSSRFIDIEEILDSEDDMLAAFSPTPPQSRKLQESEPLPLIALSPTRSSKAKAKSNANPVSDPTLSPIHKVPSSHLTWEAVKPSVSTSITAHIRALPPTTDPKRPSWHEKILMYDPIVLEDFTAYLNAHTLIRTYKKATQKQVKAWNKHLKSIGQAEIGVVEWEDKVLAVEKELECYQVRDWCEGQSICCIWGEGRGKGGVRKGFY